MAVVELQDGVAGQQDGVVQQPQIPLIPGAVVPPRDDHSAAGTRCGLHGLVDALNVRALELIGCYERLGLQYGPSLADSGHHRAGGEA